jgi:hypothetical protein
MTEAEIVTTMIIELMKARQILFLIQVENSPSSISYQQAKSCIKRLDECLAAGNEYLKSVSTDNYY